MALKGLTENTFQWKVEKSQYEDTKILAMLNIDTQHIAPAADATQKIVWRANYS